MKFDPTAFSILAGALTLLGGAIVSWIVSLRTSGAAVRSQAKKDNLDELREKQAAYGSALKTLRENYEAEITRLNLALQNCDSASEVRRQQVETLFDEINQTKSAQVAVVSEFTEHKKMCQEMKADLLEQIEMLKGALKTTTAVATAAQAVATQPAATPPVASPLVSIPPLLPGAAVKAEVVNSPDAPVPVTSGLANSPPDGEKPR